MPLVHCLSILAHNEKGYLFFLFSPLSSASLNGNERPAFSYLFFFYLSVWFGVPPQFRRYKLRWGCAALLANLGEPRMSSPFS